MRIDPPEGKVCEGKVKRLRDSVSANPSLSLWEAPGNEEGILPIQYAAASAGSAAWTLFPVRYGKIRTRERVSFKLFS